MILFIIKKKNKEVNRLDIRYVKTNIEKISEYDLIKMMIDMILGNISLLENYNENKSYKISDRVYIDENGSH